MTGVPVTPVSGVISLAGAHLIPGVPEGTVVSPEVATCSRSR